MVYLLTREHQRDGAALQSFTHFGLQFTKN